jgi:hypothetical protein
MSPTAAMDDRLLLAEEVMLLMLPDTGKVCFGLENARYPLTGALLVELAIRGHVDVRHEEDTTYIRAARTDSGEAVDAPTDELLAVALTALDDEEHKVATFVENTFPKIAEAVLERLAERGIIERETTKTLWVFTTTKWPEKDSRPEAALRSSITDVLEGRTEPDERTGSIIALLSAAQKLNDLKPPLPWNKEIKKRAEAIAGSNWGSVAVSAAVESVTAAVTAAVSAVFIATTTTTATSFTP